MIVSRQHVWASTFQQHLSDFHSPPLTGRVSAARSGCSGSQWWLGNLVQCPLHHQGWAPHWWEKEKYTHHTRGRPAADWRRAECVRVSYTTSRVLSWPSSAGGSQACSLTFHSLICWSQERRLYFLNLLGVFGWTPGWRMCLKTRNTRVNADQCITHTSSRQALHWMLCRPT